MHKRILVFLRHTEQFIAGQCSAATGYGIIRDELKQKASAGLQN